MMRANTRRGDRLGFLARSHSQFLYFRASHAPQKARKEHLALCFGVGAGYHANRAVDAFAAAAMK